MSVWLCPKLITSVQHPAGQSLVLSYLASGNVGSITHFSTIRARKTLVIDSIFHIEVVEKESGRVDPALGAGFFWRIFTP
jgi:hypothetical protein